MKTRAYCKVCKKDMSVYVVVPAIMRFYPDDRYVVFDSLCADADVLCNECHGNLLKLTDAETEELIRAAFDAEIMG